MKAIKLRVLIGSERRLVVDLPDGIRQGPAELILLTAEDAELAEANPELAEPGPEVDPLAAHIASLLAHPRGRSADELDEELDRERAGWD